MQEIIELVVFGLIALLLGTGLLWVLGWLFGIFGIVFKFVAGFIWSLLRFIVPIVIIGGVAYALVRFIQSQSNRSTAADAAPVPPPAPAPAPVTTAPPPPAAGTEGTHPPVGDDEDDMDDDMPMNDDDMDDMDDMDDDDRRT